MSDTQMPHPHMPGGSAGIGAQPFCWTDLATTDAQAAKLFYGRLFGWTAHDRQVGDGRISVIAAAGRPCASLYQLTRRQIGEGVPSHWTGYVGVPDVDAAARMAARLGGQVIVAPHDVEGFARISLIADPTGALVGLWQGPQPAGLRQAPPSSAPSRSEG